MENELKDILNKFNAWDYLQDNITKYNEIVWEWSKRDLSDEFQASCYNGWSIRRYVC